MMKKKTLLIIEVYFVFFLTFSLMISPVMATDGHPDTIHVEYGIDEDGGISDIREYDSNYYELHANRNMWSKLEVFFNYQYPNFPTGKLLILNFDTIGLGGADYMNVYVKYSGSSSWISLGKIEEGSSSIALDQDNPDNEKTITAVRFYQLNWWFDAYSIEIDYIKVA